jgi:hypothetical protein
MVLLGTGVNMTIHDHLDGAFVRLKILAESGLIFAPLDATIPNIMNGAPRVSFGSEFNVLLWLVYFFGLYPAYVLNQIIIRFIAFIGMYLLLQKHVLAWEKNEVVSAGSALAFACLPFYAHFGLSVAGQPFVFYAFLNIRQHDMNLKNWLIIALVPFYSIFGISNLFLLCAMGGLLFYDWLGQKTFSTKFACAIAFMFGVSLIVDYRLVLSVLFSSIGFVSHRTEFVYDMTGTWVNAIKDAKDNFIFGQGHAASLHHMLILPAAGLAAATVLIRQIKIPLFFQILGLTLLISFWYGIWPLCWQLIIEVKKGIPFLNLGRFHYLHPSLWYVLFALSLNIIWRYIRFGQIIVIAALVIQTGFLISQNDHFVNKHSGNPTYADFFSAQLFSDIDKTIGQNKNTYRVVSIGIHPSISQYNGFYTLDGLLYNYPLAYKRQFRQLFSSELEKSEYWRSYYDGWGSRFYIMVKDLEGYKANAFMLREPLVRYLKARIEKLSFNTELFKKMGGKYIFSAVEILNSQENGLFLIKIFDRPDSIWRIFLYEAA